MNPTPYSYVTSGGVSNARVRVADDEATLDNLHAAFQTPVQLNVPSIKYHNGSPKERSAVKAELNYFVGGQIDGRRHDDNVTSRTLLTLDVEQGPKDEAPPPSPDTVTDRLVELGGGGWVYTSLSHVPDSPRYRVVLPLGEAITGTTEEMQAALKASTIAAARRLGIEDWTKPESWVLSQPMYLPAKLKGGTFYTSYHTGKPWGTRTAVVQGASEGRMEEAGPADIDSAVDAAQATDPILHAIKKAGLYVRPKKGHKGMHFIKCPFLHLHDNENETQTVYYEAHFDGNPRPAVKCFDTAPDVDGVPHLTYGTLVRFLRENGATDEGDDNTVLDDYDAFDRASDMSRLLDGPTLVQSWAIPQFAPVGRVTVVAGPGGQGKSLAMLHLMVHAACGQPWGQFQCPAPLRSLYVSYEDGPAQLQARTQAVASAVGELNKGTLGLLHDIPGMVRQNLRVYAADDDAAAWVLLTKPDRFGLPEQTERVKWLIGYLKSRKVRMLVLDPVVFTHQLNENDIADMATYMQTLSTIAREASLAVVVIHHMSKAGGFGALDFINQNSMRGASSLADNSRSVMAGITMPIEDCPTYGIDKEQRSRYFVFKHVKHNYSAPLPTMVFHNQDGILTYRPDVKRMDDAQIEQVKEQQKTDKRSAQREVSVIRVLEYLRGLSTGSTASTTMIRDGAQVHAREASGLLEYVEANGWCHSEEEGRRRSFCITKDGKDYLKAWQKTQAK